MGNMESLDKKKVKVDNSHCSSLIHKVNQLITEGYQVS